MYICKIILFFYHIDCKKLFHTKCIQNGGVLQMPCIQQNGSNRPTNRRKSRKPASAFNKAHITPNIANSQNNTTIGKFSLTGTSEFTDRTDKIISDVRELKMMQDFITKKVSSINCFYYEVIQIFQKLNLFLPIDFNVTIVTFLKAIL